jgi:YNFM family putative membrane transporter
MSTSTSTRLGIVVAIACLTTCFAVATVYSSQAVFSDISIKYGMSVSDARFAFSICSIAYALAFFVMGPLSDLFSARVLAATGLLVAAGATALNAVSANQLTFVFASAVQGASAAAVPVAMFALLPRLARKDQVGTYFGLIIAASVVGITLGRAGMGLLTASVGLSAAQMGSAIILLIMSVLLAALPKEPLTYTPRVGLDAYVRALRMLASPDLVRLLATGFFLFFGYLGAVTFLTLRLNEPPFALDSDTIGSISLLGLGAVMGAPISGRLTGRYGSLTVGVVGLGIVMGAIVCLALAESVMGISGGLFLIFLGTFVCQPAVFVRIAERVPTDRRGAASSLYLLTCLGAGSLASAALGPLWTAAGWTGVTTACLTAVAASLLLLVSDRAPRRKVIAQRA